MGGTLFVAEDGNYVDRFDGTPLLKGQPAAYYNNARGQDRRKRNSRAGKRRIGDGTSVSRARERIVGDGTAVSRARERIVGDGTNVSRARERIVGDGTRASRVGLSAEHNRARDTLNCAEPHSRAPKRSKEAVIEFWQNLN